MTAAVLWDSERVAILDPTELRDEYCALVHEGDCHTARATLKRATPGQLWERIRSRNANGQIVSNAQLERMAPVLTHTDRQPPLVHELDLGLYMTARMAEGHARRHGHQLTGFYVLQGGSYLHGMYRLQRTCCDA